MTSLSFARAPLACFVLVLATSGCSSSANEAPSFRTEAPIINGTPGGPPQVGRLLWTNSKGSWWFCTGTLVSAELVLSARHCLYDHDNDDALYADEGEWVFQLYDAAKDKFTDDTKIKETFAPPISSPDNFAEWSAPLGAPDVALFRLATPITRLPPLPISVEPVSLAKPQFTATGFGFVSHNQDTAIPLPIWGRNSTPLVLTALKGAYLHVPFPTFNAFVAAIAEEDGVDVSTYSADDKAEFKGWYDGTMAEGFEGYLLDEMGGQPCHGDSGGPLLQQDAAGKLQIYGTVSGGLSLNNSQCDFGEIYGLFNEPVQDFLNEHGLLGPAPGGGSGGSGGAGGTSSAGAGSGVAGLGGTASGGIGAGGAGGGTAGSSFAGASTIGGGGAPIGMGGSAFVGSAGTAGVAGKGANAGDSGDESDSSSCNAGGHPTRGSSAFGMLTALFGLLLSARRRRD